MQEDHVLSRKFVFSLESIAPWMMFILAALFYCYEFLLRILPSVMINNLMSSFGISASVLGSSLAYYYYIYAPMQLPVGILMDRYSPRYLLTFSCLLCAVSALCFSYTTHTYIIGFSRAMMGLGSAFAFVGVLKIASVWLPDKGFAMLSGFAMTIGMLGAIAGNNLLADLVKHIGWQSSFLYTGYIGAILTAALFFMLRDSPGTSSKASSKRSSEKLTFRKLWPQIIVLFKNPLVWLNGFIGGLLYLPISAFAALWGIPFIQNAYHMSAPSAAGVISMVFIGMALGSPLTGWVSDRLGQRCSLMGSGAALSGVLAAIIIFIPGLSLQVLSATLFLLGVTTSVQVLVFPIVRDMTSKQLSGTALACTNMIVMLMGAVSQSVMGYLLDLKWNGLKMDDHPVYSAANYEYALFLLPVGLFLAASLTLLLRRRVAT